MTETPHRPVVVAVDGSDESMLACRAAADIAASWRVPLHAVHVWTPYFITSSAGGMGVVAPSIRDVAETLEGAALDVMAQAHALAVEHGCGRVVDHVVENAVTVDAILDVATAVDAELVVMGRRGLGIVGRVFLGSVSEGVLHHSTRPLLLMHGDAESWPPRTVVAAVDGSGESMRAARLGASVAAAARARVELVHAVPRDATFLLDLDATAYQATLAELQALYEDRAEVLARETGAPVGVCVELAAAVPAILAALSAGPAPVLVAMGTHGRGAAHRMVLGSVATTVLHDDAVASMLIVPPTTRRGR